MGNQQATLNRAVPLYPCGRAGLWGSRVALFSQKARIQESPQRPYAAHPTQKQIWKGEEMVQTTTSTNDGR